MDRQMRLPLAVHGQDALRRLWEQIPDADRAELTEQYAQLIARAARDSSHPSTRQGEANREVCDH